MGNQKVRKIKNPSGDGAICSYCHERIKWYETTCDKCGHVLGKKYFGCDDCGIALSSASSTCTRCDSGEERYQKLVKDGYLAKKLYDNTTNSYVCGKCENHVGYVHESCSYCGALLKGEALRPKAINDESQPKELNNIQDNITKQNVEQNDSDIVFIKLKKYKEMFDEGLINDEDYRKKKKELLGL